MTSTKKEYASSSTSTPPTPTYYTIVTPQDKSSRISTPDSVTPKDKSRRSTPGSGASKDKSKRSTPNSVASKDKSKQSTTSLTTSEDMSSSYTPIFSSPQEDTTQVGTQKIVKLKNYPVRITCPHCKTRVTTKIIDHPGMITWLTCILLCLIPCCCFGCCLIPFCLSFFDDVDHFCTNCGKFIARSY